MTPETLRAARLTLGMTRKQLAAVLGIAPGSLRNWEQGIRKISGPARKMIEKLLEEKHEIHHKN